LPTTGYIRDGKIKQPFYFNLASYSGCLDGLKHNFKRASQMMKFRLIFLIHSVMKLS